MFNFVIIPTLFVLRIQNIKQNQWLYWNKTSNRAVLLELCAMGRRKLCWLKPSYFDSLCDRAMNLFGV